MTEDVQPHSPSIDDLAIACDYLVNFGACEAKLIRVVLKPESFDALYASLCVHLGRYLRPNPPDVNFKATDQIIINGITFFRGDSTP